jgi:hypothetical protein
MRCFLYGFGVFVVAFVLIELACRWFDSIPINDDERFDDRG